MHGKRILLIIGGGIAAYKCLELIRRAREQGLVVRTVMTEAAQAFITPLSVGAISNERVFTDLFDLDDEREIGHIRLARDTDIVVVAPATADLLAKMAGGHANDLASAVLLATDRPVLAAPAMNPRMWLNPATRRNVAQLEKDGVHFIGPNTGSMAEAGEDGPGRMAEPHEILAAVERMLSASLRAPKEGGNVGQKLAGRRVLITAGPTHEPIDPVRYLANRSSGKQGYAIAAAAARLGAAVTLVSGPTQLADPPGVRVIRVESASDMLTAVEAALPADAAVLTAAVADWRVATVARDKIKKGANAPALALVENPDILARIAARGPRRPALVIGFAAETEKVVDHAKAKRKAKGCDWMVANDVSPASGVMGGDKNSVHLLTDGGIESWPQLDKREVAERLVARIAEHLARGEAKA